jgi:outer membrane receptor for monomeric catechols
LNTFEMEIQEFDWDEYFGRAYLNWAPHPWLALSAEYQYEEFKRGGAEDVFIELKEVVTHRFPLAANFFHPSGFSAGLKATYITQDGEFLPQLASEFQSGDDQFWVVDAVVRYRLPNRWGWFSVGVRNLFDEAFQYYDTDPRNPSIQPDRMFYAKVTLALP